MEYKPGLPYNVGQLPGNCLQNLISTTEMVSDCTRFDHFILVNAQHWTLTYTERKLRILYILRFSDKTEEDELEEKQLMDRLLDVVDQRNKIVDSIDEDRLRYKLFNECRFYMYMPYPYKLFMQVQEIYKRQNRHESLW